MPFNLGLSDVFLRVRWGVTGCWEEVKGDEVLFSLHFIKGTCYQPALSLLMLTLPLAKVMFAKLLPCKVTFPFFSIYYPPEASFQACAGGGGRVMGVKFYFLDWVKYPHKLFGIIDFF